MAAAFIQIEVLGDKALARKFGKLPLRVQNQILKRSMKRGATIVAKEARSQAPVLTGKLKRGIETHAYPIRKSGKFAGAVTVTVRAKGREHFDIPADDPWFYPSIVEYGHDKAPGKFYMRGAADAKRAEVQEMVTTDLASKIEKEFAKP